MHLERLLSHHGIVALVMLAIAPMPVKGQYRAQSLKIQSSASAGAREPFDARQITVAKVAAESPRPSRIPYILGGAVIGGVITGVAVSNELRHSEAELGPIIGAYITLAGTVLGALLGWVIYEVRY
jgi:fermentation-respiration switch protein FrsA (DUF1100 family)